VSVTRPVHTYEQNVTGTVHLVVAMAAQRVATGLRHTSLRYFNVVGSGEPRLYDTSPHNLFPLVHDALTASRVPRINGVDYPTEDGTCVRDDVRVTDLATSHVAGIDFTPKIAPCRPGAPAGIVASGVLATRDRDWKIRHTLTDMVVSAWQARQAASASADQDVPSDTRTPVAPGRPS
jgi:UDP-glucose 4-epimerase